MRVLHDMCLFIFIVQSSLVSLLNRLSLSVSQGKAVAGGGPVVSVISICGLENSWWHIVIK